jgi:hypothetical protein
MLLSAFACFPSQASAPAQALAIAAASAVVPKTLPGGSGGQLFFNEQLAATKRLATQDMLTMKGKLLPEVLSGARESIKQRWAAMTLEGKERYASQAKQERKLREERHQLEQASEACVASASACGECNTDTMWGVGEASMPFSASVICKCASADGIKLPTPAQVYDESTYKIEGGEEMKGGPPNSNKGCTQLPRNVCKHEALAPDVLDMVHAGLVEVVRLLGKPLAKSGNTLLMLEGMCASADGNVGVEDVPTRLWCFLTFPTLNTNVQDYTICEPDVHIASIDLGLLLPLDLSLDIARVAVHGKDDQDNSSKHCSRCHT